MNQTDTQNNGVPSGTVIKPADRAPNFRRITSSPQIHHPDSTTRIMWTVTACLVPAAVWSVFVYGMVSLITLAASIVSALAAEYVVGNFIFKKMTLRDGSAFLTGLLVGFNMPPSVPAYIPVVASIFAIVVVKWTFGGLGANWMNPALAGRVFVFFSWSTAMSGWTVPATNPGLDALSGASPLGFVKTGMLDYAGAAKGPMEFLRESGYSVSTMDGSVTLWINQNILRYMGITLPDGYMDLFLGNIPGSLGEVSALLLLAGAIYLLSRKIITWHIPVVYCLTFGLLVWAFGGLQFGAGWFAGDIAFHFLTGGLILGAFYMATDMVTSPLTVKGMIIYAFGTGFLTFLIRIYGSLPEGVSLAIILMNMVVPLINRYTGPKRFGVTTRRNPA